ncbi:MAG: HAMP domain-containing sensor histidine kinase [Clostridiales bacterium]|nr:HAMP domain-containing sensor histidine kinase [Clostridiales bacterium]
MLSQLRRHLIRLYSCLTSIILTVALFTACFMNCTQRIAQYKNRYKVLLNNAINKLLSENVISYDWLMNFELQNKIILHIEDNGVPFLFRGSWSPDIPKENLFEYTKQLSANDGYSITSVPYFLKDAKISRIYQYSYTYTNNKVRYDHNYFIGTPVFSNVVFIPAKNGYLTLTLVQFLPQLKASLISVIIFFLLLDLAGVFALYFSSRYLVDKALKPIKENNRKQTEFIAAASHDLRTPLAIIQCNASALLLPDANPETIVPKIMDSCTSMSRLVTDLLSLAASDTKTWKLNVESFDTESFLVELYDSYSVYCQSRNHTLTLNFPEDALPPILADQGRVNQILGILIDNALSYSPEHTEILIKPYVLKQNLVIEVVDRGKGVPDSEKSEIFTRFYRADKSRGDQKHFGLGLSIAKELIELQKGKIYVKDTVNGGATFIIEIPIAM